MDDGSRIGELAALATAACWTGSAVSFEIAGRRIGSLAVNLIRLVMALGLLTLFGAIVRGSALPVDADAHAWGWLAVSGLVGFVLGDMCLFRAFILLGTRLSTLVMSLWPSLAALMSWAILGEGMAPAQLGGLTLTLAGVALAVTERAPPTPDAAQRRLGRGLLLALGGAVGQALGVVLSKLGMGDYDAFAATQIRVMAGIVGFAALFTVIGWWGRVRAGLRDRRGMTFTFTGAITGPFLGVSLSLYAIKHTQTGAASAIMATTPILIIPVVAILYRERIGPQGVAGAVLAVCGVALLFLA